MKPAAAQAVTNAPEWTVSELSGALKRTIEGEFGFVRVRAEITGYKGPHASGHAYFCLKDQGARIDAVIWRTTFARLRVKPAEGLEVVITGKVTTFPGKSAYQIIVDTLEPAGLGALMALLEERRRMLAAEGLFDAARKQILPYLPRIIGVVTSPSGAVIRDILHRIADRFPSHVLVWPVRVQGETSAAEIAAAIRGFNAFVAGQGIVKPDVLIVARGGGALEDLWSFNEEIVVRAAAESGIALIAAVGHETDWTLIDHAADLRAPTPTGAAEMCLPVRSALMAQLGDYTRRHAAAALRILERRRAELTATARAMPVAEELLAGPRQRLDAASQRAGHETRTGLDARRIRLGRLAGRLAAQSPQARLARAAARLDGLGSRLGRAAHVARDRRREALTAGGTRLRTAMLARASLARQKTGARREQLDTRHLRLRGAFRAAVAARDARLAALEQLLGTLGYRNVLARGFALVRDERGSPVRSIEQVRPTATLDIEFADGHIAVTEGSEPPAPAPVKLRAGKAAAKPDAPVRQGFLF